MITLYGIPNCDSVKKGRNWLDENGHEYSFHDFRKQGLDAALLKAWLKKADWKVLLNTKGTTWRTLSEEQRANPDLAKATELMLAHPTLIKRPVVAHAGGLLVGFDAERWAAELSA
ncbi:MAG: ArsC family reductase [Rhodocyclaceae bacterium]